MRQRLRGCLMVAFLFLCGFLVGGFLGAAVGWLGFFHKIVKGGPGAVRDVVMERVTKDLNLNRDQKIRVRKIMNETGAELAVATAEARPKIEEIMGHSEERIRELLSAKQRVKFNAFVNEGRHRWKAAMQANSTPMPKPGRELERPSPAPAVP